MLLALLLSCGSYARLLTEAPKSVPLDYEALQKAGQRVRERWNDPNAEDDTNIAGTTGKSGHVPIGSKGSSMFYWFIQSSAGDLSSTLPLILWLQGGPGCSSMTGQFFEFGPIEITSQTTYNFDETTNKFAMTTELTPSTRATSWSSKAHLLFIDNPLGAGYSFAADPSEYVTNEDQMATNLYSALQQLAAPDKYADWFNRDVYIFGESYAGKYIPSIAYKILQGNKDTQNINIKLKGVGIGDGITDPIYQFSSYSTFAYDLGLVDEKEKSVVQGYEEITTNAIKNSDWATASAYSDKITSYIVNQSGGVNVYNIREYGNYDTTNIDNWLGSDGAKTLFHVDTNVTFQDCSAEAYAAMANDIPQSVVDKVVSILDDITVLLFNGQDDLIINTPGAENWIDAMQWSGASDFSKAERKQWTVNSVVAGLYKKAGNLVYVNVYKSGHMVPKDQLENSIDLVDKLITGGFAQQGQAQAIKKKL